MASILNFTRGSYYISPATITRSVIRIEGVNLPSPGVLVSNFQFNDQEKNGIIQCFGEVNHIYAFGHDPESSGFAVTFHVFMGKRCMRNNRFQDSGNLRKLIAEYDKLRVSKSKSTVNVTFGNGMTLVGIVLSATATVADPELNMLSVTISGKSIYIK